VDIELLPRLLQAEEAWDTKGETASPYGKAANIALYVIVSAWFFICPSYPARFVIHRPFVGLYVSGAAKGYHPPDRSSTLLERQSASLAGTLYRLCNQYLDKLRCDIEYNNTQPD
jgi:hypothetical protein